MLFTFHQIVPRRVGVLHISMSQKKKTENSTHIILYYKLCILKHAYKYATELAITQTHRNISNLNVFIYRKRLKMTNNIENGTLKYLLCLKL